MLLQLFLELESDISAENDRMSSDSSNLNFDCRCYTYRLEKVDLNYRIEREDMHNNFKNYMGGSKLNHQTCFAFIFNNNRLTEIYNMTYRLNNESTFYIAELTTIQNVLEYCNTNLVNKEVHKIIDSLSALTSIVLDNEDRVLQSNSRRI